MIEASINAVLPYLTQIIIVLVANIIY
jgi:hypothetical protein